jgi:hypothetical protein
MEETQLSLFQVNLQHESIAPELWNLHLSVHHRSRDLISSEAWLLKVLFWYLNKNQTTYEHP